MLSQSFIHQVRILSVFFKSKDLFKLKDLSQSFIHQVRILSSSLPPLFLSRASGRRNPLFIKSEFSLQRKKWKVKLAEKSVSVAILYSSSQNSLHRMDGCWKARWKGSQSFIHQVRILSTPLAVCTTAGILRGMSQSFIHQVRILSWWEG